MSMRDEILLIQKHKRVGNILYEAQIILALNADSQF